MDSRAPVGNISGIARRRRGRGSRRRSARIARGGSVAAGRAHRNAPASGRRAAGLRARPERPELPVVSNLSGMAFSFGATRVGVLLERMRLHLNTQRFLAERRGDRIWQASCDCAALSLERLGARLRPEAFAAELFPVRLRARGGSFGTRPKRPATAKRTGRLRARGGR